MTIMLVGIGRVLTMVPAGVIWSRKMGDVTPKLPSTVSLFQTLLVLAGARIRAVVRGLAAQAPGARVGARRTNRRQNLAHDNGAWRACIDAARKHQIPRA